MSGIKDAKKKRARRRRKRQIQRILLIIAMILILIGFLFLIRAAVHAVVNKFTGPSHHAQPRSQFVWMISRQSEKLYETCSSWSDTPG